MAYFELLDYLYRDPVLIIMSYIDRYKSPTCCACKDNHDIKLLDKCQLLRNLSISNILVNSNTPDYHIEFSNRRSSNHLVSTIGSSLIDDNYKYEINLMDDNYTSCLANVNIDTDYSNIITIYCEICKLMIKYYRIESIVKSHQGLISDEWYGLVSSGHYLLAFLHYRFSYTKL